MEFTECERNGANMKKKTLCILISILIFLTFSVWSLQAAEENPSQDNIFSIAINPVKSLPGLINLDLEFQITPHISIHIFSEILIKEADHPDLVISLGPRYYFFPGKLNVAGFYSGVNLGYAWYKASSGNSSMTIGGEVGYKHILNGELFILPRGVVTYPVSNGQFLLGVEFFTGTILLSKARYLL